MSKSKTPQSTSTKEINQQKEQSLKLAKVKGERFKLARKMANLTMEQLADKYDFGLSTIKMWEKPSASFTKIGLTQKGAMKFIDAIYKEGIFCDLYWLLGEAGNPPGFLIQEERATYSRDESVDAIEKEIIYFSELNTDAMTLILNDDGMAPYYAKSDTVGGIRCAKNEIEKLVNKICIVELEDGRKLCRRLTKNKKPGYYNLHCINIMTSVEEPQQFDVKLISAAEVIRLWRKKI